VYRLRLQQKTEESRVRTRGGVPRGARRIRVPAVRKSVPHTEHVQGPQSRPQIDDIMRFSDSVHTVQRHVERARLFITMIFFIA
jgi:hypothetical protein